jgi:hypothetical protein
MIPDRLCLCSGPRGGAFGESLDTPDDLARGTQQRVEVRHARRSACESSCPTPLPWPPESVDLSEGACQA